MRVAVDNRTYTGMDRQIKATFKSDQTHVLSGILQQHKDILQVCEVFIPGKLESTPWPDIVRAMNKIVRVFSFKSWPWDTINDIFSYRMSIHRSNMSWSVLIECMEYWVEKELDHVHLHLASFPNTPAIKQSAIFARIMFRETLNNLIIDGTDSMADTLEFVTLLTRRFDGVDIVDVPPAVVANIRQRGHVATYIRLLLDGNLAESCLEANIMNVPLLTTVTGNSL